MYQTEKEFVKVVSMKLKKQGADTMLVETAGTTVGCPDMFVQAAGEDWWIEFKNIRTVKDSTKLQVPWRPGQQAWALNYRRAHTQAHSQEYKAIKCSWTFIAAADMIWLVRMDKVYADNVVLAVDSSNLVLDKQQFNNINLVKFLYERSYILVPSVKDL